MLGLPVGIGMAVRRRFPGFALSHRSAVQRAGFLALALLILLVMYSQWADCARGASGTIGLAAVFVGLSFSVGWIVALALTEAPLLVTAALLSRAVRRSEPA